MFFVHVCLFAHLLRQVNVPLVHVLINKSIKHNYSHNDLKMHDTAATEKNLSCVHILTIIKHLAVEHPLLEYQYKAQLKRKRKGVVIIILIMTLLPKRSNKMLTIFADKLSPWIKVVLTVVFIKNIDLLLNKNNLSRGSLPCYTRFGFIYLYLIWS